MKMSCFYGLLWKYVKFAENYFADIWLRKAPKTVAEYILL